jgi:6-phosphofructokinase 1
MRDGILGALHENLVDLTNISQARLDLVTHTPASALGSSRRKLSDDDCARIVSVLKAHDLHHFIYIGGSDSMDTCRRVEAAAREQSYSLAVMGVPKTIDNTLPHTDHTPGYGSAARLLAMAARDTARDLEAMHTVEDVALFEVMDHSAGWLTAATTLGRGTPDDAPHLLYMPEVPFDLDAFLDDILRQHDERGFAMAAISEGIQGGGGRPVTEAAGGDSLRYLAEQVRQSLGLRVREIRPDTLQRSGSLSLSTVDLAEATLVGQEAVRQAAAGNSGHMVNLVREAGQAYHCRTGLVPLSRVANAVRPLPESFIALDGRDVSHAFRDYAMPLLGDPLPPHGRLGGLPVTPNLPAY